MPYFPIHPEILLEMVKCNSNIVNVFKCGICFSVSIEPVKCTKCESIWCGSCIRSNNNLCPLKCNLAQFTGLNRQLMEIYNTFLIDCGYCKLFDLFLKSYSSHLQRCVYADYKCKYCNKISKIHDIREHFIDCPNKSQFCKMCFCSLLLKDMSEHSNVCEMRIVECNGCKKEIFAKYPHSCFKEL